MNVSKDKPKRRARKPAMDCMTHLCWLASDVAEQAERLKATADNLLASAQAARKGAR